MQKVSTSFINITLNMIFAILYPVFFMIIFWIISEETYFSARIWLISYIGAMIVYRIALCFQINFKKPDIWFIIMSMVFYIISIIFNSVEIIKETEYKLNIILLILFSIIVSSYIIIIDKIHEYYENRESIKRDKELVKKIREESGDKTNEN